MLGNMCEYKEKRYGLYFFLEENVIFLCSVFSNNKINIFCKIPKYTWCIRNFIYEGLRAKVAQAQHCSYGNNRKNL